MAEAEVLAPTQPHERNGRPTVELKALIDPMKQQTLRYEHQRRSTSNQRGDTLDMAQCSSSRDRGRTERVNDFDTAGFRI